MGRLHLTPLFPSVAKRFIFPACMEIEAKFCLCARSKRSVECAIDKRTLTFVVRRNRREGGESPQPTLL